ncbi:hypothetical protein KGP36_08210, partial [Patescibacteria group bacterium]|nr:hypothetical protein [Patescibacteria group bacterium]
MSEILGEGQDNFDFTVQTSLTNVNYKCNNAVFANRWSLVSVTWNGIVGAGAAVTGYVNGAPCANGSLNSSSGTAGDDSSYHADIGTVSGTHSQYFDGSIDDVRVYNRVLSAAEVKQLYQQGNGGVTIGSTIASGPGSLNQGLVGYWTFNNQDMNWATGKAYDRSGQGNNGNFVNLSTTT